MNAELFLRGLAIGFGIAFALGPIGLLVIRRTIDHGWVYGFVSALGVATADSMYAAVAAFGLTAVSGLLMGIDRLLGIAGGTVLVVLAARALRAAIRGVGLVEARARGGRPAGHRLRPVGAWASMVALTLTNPATILSFTALFASLGAGVAGTGGAAWVVAGVFAGSVAWWALLTGLVAGTRTRLTPRAVRSMNIGSALLIGGFGLVAIFLGIRG